MPCIAMPYSKIPLLKVYKLELQELSDWDLPADTNINERLLPNLCFACIIIYKAVSGPTRGI
jgi:hypothetical protein